MTAEIMNVVEDHDSKESENTSENWNYKWADCMVNQLSQPKKLVKKRIKKSEEDIKDDIEKIKLKTKLSQNKKWNIRIKPSTKDAAFEKYLKQIGTQGVTHFFNTVKAQQNTTKDLPEKFSKHDVGLKNIDKTRFLDVLFKKPDEE